MKRIAVVLFLAAPALAHKVPAGADNPALQYLKDEKRPDLVDGVLQYCAKANLPIEICVGRLGHDLRAAEAAAACSKASGLPFDPAYAHQLQPAGVGPESPKEKEWVYHGNWITPSDSANLKAYGEHRHLWSEGARELAGFKMGAENVEGMKKIWAGYETTEVKNLDAGAKAALAGEMAQKIGAKLPGLGSAEQQMGLKADIAAHIQGKSESKETLKGPPASVIERTFEKGREIGEKYPHLTKQMADILESKDKNKSINTNILENEPAKSADVKPKPEPATAGCNSSIQSCGPTPQKSGIAQGAETPLEDCQMALYQQKTATNLFSTYEQQSAPQESLRKRAEEALKNGMCLEEWFGEKFCQGFNAQKTWIQTQPDTAPIVVQAPSLPLIAGQINPLVATIEPQPTAPPVTAETTCADPNISDGQKAALGCVNLWCRDARATEAEKLALGCPEY